MDRQGKGRGGGKNSRAFRTERFKRIRDKFRLASVIFRYPDTIESTDYVVNLMRRTIRRSGMNDSEVREQRIAPTRV